MLKNTITTMKPLTSIKNYSPLTLKMSQTTTTTTSKGPLPSRPATSQEQTIINEILKLYCLQPSEQAYSHYTPTATFHDPVSIAKRLETIKSQFNGMPKLFGSSTTQICEVLDSSTPDSLELNLTQRYVFKSPLPGKNKKEGRKGEDGE